MLVARLGLLGYPRLQYITVLCWSCPRLCLSTQVRSTKLGSPAGTPSSVQVLIAAPHAHCCALPNMSPAYSGPQELLTWHPPRCPLCSLSLAPLLRLLSCEAAAAAAASLAARILLSAGFATIAIGSHCQSLLSHTASSMAVTLLGLQTM